MKLHFPKKINYYIFRQNAFLFVIAYNETPTKFNYLIISGR